jgi:CelD/BcsL family acetyltransferase involved in cellulose biosynthesis
VPNPCEIRPVTAADREAWNSVVDDHPSATVFHTRAWLRAVDSAFRYDPEHYLVYETGGDDPVGVVPGFSVSGPGGRTVVNPFCEYGFPLLAGGVDPVAVLRALAADVGPLGARVLKDAGWTDNRAYNAAGYGAVRTGEVIRLDTDREFDEVRERSFTGEARRCLRLSTEAGVTVRPAGVDEYYPLYLATMRRLGSPQFPEAFFRDLAAELADDFLVLVAESDGETVGGLVALDHAGVRMVWSNASRRTAWDLHPNHHLYAAAIEDACETGIDVVDFGRSRPGTGVHDFKAGFGGRRSPLASFVTPPHRAGRASLEGYGKAAAVAERLGPVFTHSEVGPRLKRFIHE